MKEIGPHRITCASVESPLVDEMLRGKKAAVLYSDPPWGDGNAKFWATINKKMTGKVFAPLTYEQLLNRIDQLVEKHVHGRVFIETGPRSVDQLAARFAGKYHNVGKTALSYKGGGEIYPCWLVSATTTPSLPPFHVEQLLGVGGTGAKTVLEWIVAHDHLSGGSIVLDPFCGMGYTARAAVHVGMTFYGNEFNEKRLGKTLEFLESHENILKADSV